MIPSSASSSAIRSASSRSSSSSSSFSPKPRAISSGGAISPPSEMATRRDDDQHAVLGEPSPVAERDVLDVADAEPVDEGDAGGDPVDDADARAASARRRSRSRRSRSPAAGMPASRPSFACAASIRYSPWIGMSAFGRTSDSSVRSSSEQAWPETCTGAISSWSTSAPRRASRLIESWTRSSLPGTGFAEMITVSPRSTSTFWWSP